MSIIKASGIINLVVPTVSMGVQTAPEETNPCIDKDALIAELKNTIQELEDKIDRLYDEIGHLSMGEEW
jgi:hypothetical protein